MLDKSQARDFIIWVKEEAQMAGVPVKTAIVERRDFATMFEAIGDPQRVVISFHGQIPLDKLWRFARGRKADVGVTHEGDLMLKVV